MPGGGGRTPGGGGAIGGEEPPSSAAPLPAPSSSKDLDALAFQIRAAFFAATTAEIGRARDVARSLASSDSTEVPRRARS